MKPTVLNDQLISRIPCVELPHRITRGAAGLDAADEAALAKALQLAYEGLVELDDDLRNLLTCLSDIGARAVLFGGWARDRIHEVRSGSAFPSRDIDLVVDGAHQRDLARLLPQGAQPNLFGGFSVALKTVQLDVWAVESTFLIRKLNLSPDLSILPRTTVFRINSVIFRPANFWGKPGIGDSGCVDALTRRTVDFQAKVVPFPEMQVARAMIYAAKFSFDVDDEVSSLTRSVCASSESRNRVVSGLRQYCPQGLFQTAVVRLRSLCAGVV